MDAVRRSSTLLDIARDTCFNRHSCSDQVQLTISTAALLFAIGTTSQHTQKSKPRSLLSLRHEISWHRLTTQYHARWSMTTSASCSTWEQPSRCTCLCIVIGERLDTQHLSVSEHFRAEPHGSSVHGAACITPVRVAMTWSDILASLVTKSGMCGLVCRSPCG